MNVASKIKLNNFDSLLGSDTSVINVPLEKLHTFKNHPFKVLDDENMQELVDSIKENGVLSPALVREAANGEYELISGHRRKHACELAGIKEMPVLVQNLTDDEATIIMVDSNIQREELLPSEKAYAYKMKLEALKRKPGRPSFSISMEIDTFLRWRFSKSPVVGTLKNIKEKREKIKYIKSLCRWNGGTLPTPNGDTYNGTDKGIEFNFKNDKTYICTWSMLVDKIDALIQTNNLLSENPAQIEQKKASVEILAEEVGESRATVQRLIRLTYLNNELMEYVDNKELPLNVGVELSYLSLDEQKRVVAAIEDSELMPSIAMAKKFREYSEQDMLTKRVIDVIMKEVTDKPVAVKLTSRTKRLFPETYTRKDMSDLVERLVKEYFENGGE